jgi:alcohol dehydrogenase (cytochrome c)
MSLADKEGVAKLAGTQRWHGRNPPPSRQSSRPRARWSRFNQHTGQIEWDTRRPSSPYGAATVTSNVVFTTTFHGDQYALNTATGAILRKIPLSAGTNAPITVDGDYVIAGAGVPLSKTQQPLIIAYKLGATASFRRP